MNELKKAQRHAVPVPISTDATFRLIVESAPNAITLVDSKGVIVLVNKRTEEMFGYSRDEIVGQRVERLLPERFRGTFPGDLSGFIALAQSRPMGEGVEFSALRKDGSEFLMEIGLNPVETAEGMMVLSSIVDITERKRIVEIHRLAALVESSDDAIISKTLEGIIMSWNPGAEKIFGYTAEEAIGKSIGMLAPAERAKEEPEILGRIAGGELVKHYETVRVRKDGKLIDVSVTVSPIKDSTGKILGASKIARDISEQKRFESQLKATMQDLARSNSELEQFAYVASHDLQEPLRMVSSYVQLLAQKYEGKLDADADDFIGFAVDGAARMQRLINDLLVFSRVGTKGKEFKQCNCEAILEDVLDNLQRLIEETGAVVTHDPLPTVLGDSTQLIQLFQNLIENGIKFRGAVPPRIHITVSKQEDEWLFSVRDNGIGIEKEYFDRIFIIFQRLHDKATYKGTGIGLAVCRKIVEKHGGRIWVESTFGSGTTFNFTLSAKGKQ